MKTLELKEGQTYICSKSDQSYWTVGKEYHVFLNDSGVTVLADDDGDKWNAHQLSDTSIQFKSKYPEPKYTPRYNHKQHYNF